MSWLAYQNFRRGISTAFALIRVSECRLRTALGKFAVCIVTETGTVARTEVATEKRTKTRCA